MLPGPGAIWPSHPDTGVKDHQHPFWQPGHPDHSPLSLWQWLGSGWHGSRFTPAGRMPEGLGRAAQEPFVQPELHKADSTQDQIWGHDSSLAALVLSPSALRYPGSKTRTLFSAANSRSSGYIKRKLWEDFPSMACFLWYCKGHPHSLLCSLPARKKTSLPGLVWCSPPFDGQELSGDGLASAVKEASASAIYLF